MVSGIAESISLNSLRLVIRLTIHLLESGYDNPIVPLYSHLRENTLQNQNIERLKTIVQNLLDEAKQH
jgi:hypothetical protein